MFSLLERKYQNTSFIRRLLEPRNSGKPECFYPWIKDISLHLSHSCGKYHTGITMYLFKWQSLVVLSRIIPPEHSFSLQSWIFLACFTVVVGLLLGFFCIQEEFEDTKGAIRIRISKRNRQHNGEKKKDKRTYNDLQNIHIKLKIE